MLYHCAQERYRAGRDLRASRVRVPNILVLAIEELEPAINSDPHVFIKDKDDFVRTDGDLSNLSAAKEIQIQVFAQPVQG